MVAFGFHALGRDRPQLRLEVELIPGRSERLAAPHRGQDGKLQCIIGNPGTLTEQRHERRHRGIRQCLVVLDLCDLALTRQQVCEMTAPSGWIFAAPIAGAGREVQYALDAAAQSRCGLWLLRPDWSQYRHDGRCIDPRDWQAAEGWTTLSLQAARPFLGMPSA